MKPSHTSITTLKQELTGNATLLDMLKGLRIQNGEFSYRFKLNGQQHTGTTGLLAIAANIIGAHDKLVGAMNDAKNPKLIKLKEKELKQDSKRTVHEALEEFKPFYRGENGNKPCKWAMSLLNGIDYYFGPMQRQERTVCSLGPGDLEAFKTWRRGNDIHDHTIRKQLLLADQFFAFCRKNGWMTHDPFAADNPDLKVKIPTEKKFGTGAMYVLSVEEEKRYREATRVLGKTDLLDVTTIMDWQGCRPGELMALPKTLVDLPNRKFTIWFSTDEGKTFNAHRTLRMTKQTVPVFERRMSLPGPWLFPSNKLDGHVTTLQKQHEAVVKATGIQCRIYDHRHTFATRFATNRSIGSMPTLAKILGHADIQMLNRYCHPSQEDMDRAMEAFSLGYAQATDFTEDMLLEFAIVKDAG